MTSPTSPIADSAANGAANSAVNDAVVLRFGPGRYAAPMSAVAEVGRVPALTRVPGVPAWVAGIANWRGRILPVLDLRALLGAPVQPLPVSARLVVVSSDGMTAGLLVEAVEGLAAVPEPAELPAVPGVLPPVAAALLAGQFTEEAGSPIAVLDVAAVLRLRDQLPRARRAG